MSHRPSRNHVNVIRQQDRSYPVTNEFSANYRQRRFFPWSAGTTGDGDRPAGDGVGTRWEYS